jgi:hypothetical protein
MGVGINFTFCHVAGAVFEIYPDPNYSDDVKNYVGRKRLL